ncbi:MAG: hypothetical protein HUU26_05680 [Gemmatimonadaceae bacterium]|nr:hypothetical protein [Gemmatimonadaceae bacterium]
MRSFLFGVLSLAAASSTGAQAGRLVDVGSFTVTLGGRTVGRESFRITATTLGDQSGFLVTSDITFGDRTIEPRLRTDATGAAVEYRVRVRPDGAEEMWEGGITRGRLIASSTGPGGTAAREQVVARGTVVLDEDVIIHHWALGLRPGDRRIPVLIPRRGNAQASWTVDVLGEERLRIGTEEVAARRLRATDSAGVVREVWLDGAGRVLKVAIPSRALLAVRDDPPVG